MYTKCTQKLLFFYMHYYIALLQEYDSPAHSILLDRITRVYMNLSYLHRILRNDLVEKYTCCTYTCLQVIRITSLQVT